MLWTAPAIWSENNTLSVHCTVPVRGCLSLAIVKLKFLVMMQWCDNGRLCWSQDIEHAKIGHILDNRQICSSDKSTRLVFLRFQNGWIFFVLPSPLTSCQRSHLPHHALLHTSRSSPAAGIRRVPVWRGKIETVCRGSQRLWSRLWSEYLLYLDTKHLLCVGMITIYLDIKRLNPLLVKIKIPS